MKELKGLKVLLINGSPNEHGCTYTALSEVASALSGEGLETEIVWIGKEPIRGCIGCGGCARLGQRRCVFDGDPVNALIAKAEKADGLVFGSPVHYASAGGSITSLMDRLFYAGSAVMRGKPAAAVVSARRAGTTSAIDQLNKYFTISGMPIVSGQYWPMVHGNTPDEVKQDAEGLQIMRTLGRNMAYMIKCFALARENGLLAPAPEKERQRTNFIR